jgi:anti-sigma regulatory factor (Ser/Thr protein kinase)
MCAEMTIRIDFVLKNDLSELDTLRNHLESLAWQTDITDRCLFQMNLALDEIFSNIVHNGFRDGKEHKIHFRISLSDDILHICIEDGGIPFNPLPVNCPDTQCPLEKRSVGGLGIHLVRNMMDEVDYRREKGRNILMLRKQVRKKGEAEGRGGEFRKSAAENTYSQ